MQIEPTLARLVRLNLGLSSYFWTQRIAETFAESKLRWFRLSESLCESLSQKVKLPIELACTNQASNGWCDILHTILY